jgi:ribosomal protein L37AE/L43A
MMATRSASVSAANPQTASGRSHWPRKLLLLVLLIVAAALGLTILFRRNTNAPLFLFNAFADAALGVVAGLGSRLVFRRRHWVVRVAAATMLCLLGLLLLGHLTGGISGVGPVRFHSVTVDWLQRLGLAVRPAFPIGVLVDWWQELADVLIAASVSMLALRAWNGPYRVSVSQTTSTAASGFPLRSKRRGLPTLSALGQIAPRRSRAASAPKAPALHRRPLGLPPALALLGSRPRKSVGSRARGLGLPPALAGRRRSPTVAARKRVATLTVSRPPRPAPATGRARPRKRVRPRTAGVHAAVASGGIYGARNLLRRRRAVRLAAYEEHRCPYCLEQVRRGDPRGTVECPICHTLHHKDCWDVTGTCQIPHLAS